MVLIYNYTLFLDTSGENITELLVAEGLVEVRKGGLKPDELVEHMICQAGIVQKSDISLFASCQVGDFT